NAVISAALHAALFKTASRYCTDTSLSFPASPSTPCLHAPGASLASLLSRTGSLSVVYLVSRKNGISSSSYCMAQPPWSRKNKKPMLLASRAWVSTSRKVAELHRGPHALGRWPYPLFQ